MSIPKRRFVSTSFQEMDSIFSNPTTREEAEAWAKDSARGDSEVYVILEIVAVAVPKVEVDSALDGIPQL